MSLYIVDPCGWLRIVKCIESLSTMVSNIVRRYIDHMKCTAIMAFCLSYSFMLFWFLLFYSYVYGCVFFILLFNSVSYVSLLLCLCILMVMYALFCIFCFHRANWHSSATLRVFRAFSSVVREMAG